MKYILLLTMLLTFDVSAQSDLSFLKKDNPDELAYWAWASPECPISREDVKAIVTGVLIRSRIKPAESSWVRDPIYLNVSVLCAKVEGNNPVFNASINFGRATPYPSVIFDSIGHQQLGIGDVSFIKATIKNGVEKAVTDYIKFNFIDK